MLSILSEYSCDLTCGHRKCDTYKIPRKLQLKNHPNVSTQTSRLFSSENQYNYNNSFHGLIW